VQSIPQENPRLEIPRILWDEIVRYLREYVKRMNAELVFNFDEAGISEWEDQKPKKVLVQTAIHRMVHETVASDSLSTGLGI
jgi:hypothetical protein